MLPLRDLVKFKAKDLFRSFTKFLARHNRVHWTYGIAISAILLVPVLLFVNADTPLTLTNRIDLLAKNVSGVASGVTAQPSFIETQAYLSTQSLTGSGGAIVVPSDIPSAYLKSIFRIDGSGTVSLVNYQGQINLLTAEHVVAYSYSTLPVYSLRNALGQTIPLGAEGAKALLSGIKQFGDQIMVPLPSSLLSHPVVRDLINSNSIMRVGSTTEVAQLVASGARATVLGYPVLGQSEFFGRVETEVAKGIFIGASRFTADGPKPNLMSSTAYLTGTVGNNKEVLLMSGLCGGPNACFSGGFSGSPAVVMGADGRPIVIGQFPFGGATETGFRDSVSGAKLSFNSGSLVNIPAAIQYGDNVPEAIDNYWDLVKKEHDASIAKPLVDTKNFNCSLYGDCGRNKSVYLQAEQQMNAALINNSSFGFPKVVGADDVSFAKFSGASMIDEAIGRFFLNSVPGLESSRGPFAVENARAFATALKQMSSYEPGVEFWNTMVPNALPNWQLKFEGVSTTAPLFSSIDQEINKNVSIVINTANPSFISSESFLTALYQTTPANLDVSLNSLSAVAKNELTMGSRNPGDIVNYLDSQLTGLTPGSITYPVSSTQQLRNTANILNNLPSSQYTTTQSTLGATTAVTTNQLTDAQIASLKSSAVATGQNYEVVSSSTGQKYMIVKLGLEAGGFTLRVPIK